MVHFTVFSPVLIIIVLLAAGHISAICQREGLDFQPICEQCQQDDIADELEPLLTDYFKKIGCVVKCLKIEQLIYSFNSNVGADNSQSRSLVQLVLNNVRQLCYVSYFVGFIGRPLLNEDNTECFPYVNPYCSKKKYL